MTQQLAKNKVEARKRISKLEIRGARICKHSSNNGLRVGTAAAAIAIDAALAATTR